MRNYKVYKHTSPNGKVYIGITCRSVKERWGSNGNGYKGNTHFYNAIKKYGWDNFKHEILFDGLSKAEACNKEIELISVYNSTDEKHGYNNSTGGEYGASGRKISQETRDAISKKVTGKKRTKEQRERVSIGHIGIKHSKTQIEKIKSSNTGKHKGKLNGRCRAVKQYNLNGDYIRTYDYTRQASEELNICRQSIIQCCKGIYSQAGGYKWKYAR